MKIAVIGAGAVGGYFGGKLASDGNDVVFVVRGKTLEAPADLAAIVGPGRVAGGLCRIVAKAIAPGHVYHFWAPPSIAFGELEPLPNREHLEKLRDAFAAAGVRCDIPRDIARAMWEKFLFITPWGSLGAV